MYCSSLVAWNHGLTQPVSSRLACGITLQMCHKLSFLVEIAIFFSMNTRLQFSSRITLVSLVSRHISISFSYAQASMSRFHCFCAARGHTPGVQLSWDWSSAPTGAHFISWFQLFPLWFTAENCKCHPVILSFYRCRSCAVGEIIHVAKLLTYLIQYWVTDTENVNDDGIFKQRKKMVRHSLPKM